MVWVGCEAQIYFDKHIHIFESTYTPQKNQSPFKPPLFPHTQQYEPYFIALRDAIPLADERYRGYWANKIAWLDDIRAAGFDHVVHPDMFLMHAPHTHTSTDMYNGRVRFSYIKHRLLYDNCQRSLPYYPVVLVDDAAFCGAR